MFWNGKELNTVGDILNAVSSCKTKAEADDFMWLYSSENEHAVEDVGYLIGYASEGE